MTYISIRDALATILSKSAPVEDVLINVAPEERETLLQALVVAGDNLAKAIEEDSKLIKFNEHGQWELKTVVFNSAHPHNPPGIQAEPVDQNPDKRTGVLIDKSEDETLEQYKARGGKITEVPGQKTPKKISAQPTRGARGVYTGGAELNAKASKKEKNYTTEDLKNKFKKMDGMSGSLPDGGTTFKGEEIKVHQAGAETYSGDKAESTGDGMRIDNEKAEKYDAGGGGGPAIDWSTVPSQQITGVN